MNKECLLSVCISVHNTAKYLPRCLNSLIKQANEDFEIVLVNNGSSDGSYEIMKEFKARYNYRVTIINQDDLGLAQGRQSGVNNASGKYLTFLDADDYYYDNWSDVLFPIIKSENYDIIEFASCRDNNKLSSGMVGETTGKELLLK